MNREVRSDFPALQQMIYGKPLVYLDNAATTQMPMHVDRLMSRFNLLDRANVHRGVHEMSVRATRAYEEARRRIQHYINAKEMAEVIFTRGTTEAINLVAHAYGRKFLQVGDEIVLSEMEHHSNIVPWQLIREQTGATIKVIPITDSGELDMAVFEKMLSSKTKFVSVAHVSNALGTVNPIETIIAMTKKTNPEIPVLIDGAQAIAHMKVDVQALGCDFYAFSSHKMYGPMGVGVLYGKRALLESMQPYQGGGDMIRSVSFEKTTFNDLPFKFEAGTPNVAGVVALGAAIDYIENLGIKEMAKHEEHLVAYALNKLATVPGIKFIGTAKERISVISFTLKGIHPHDIGTILDREGIAIRAGHHCAQPVMQRFGIPATARVSLTFYNTTDEVDRLVQALHKVVEVFK